MTKMEIKSLSRILRRLTPMADKKYVNRLVLHFCSYLYITNVFITSRMRSLAVASRPRPSDNNNNNNNNKTLFRHRQFRDCCPVHGCVKTNNGNIRKCKYY